MLAINEFREFLSFYPTNKRADYAQYKLGFCHFKQMRAPQRDQTETREAIKEFEAFVDRYPTSRLLPDAKARLREAKDRLDEADYAVGYFYFRSRWYPGAATACSRWSNRTRSTPAPRCGLFYLGESLIKLKREAEALPYFERLVQEFEQSEYLPDAQRRIAELKAAATKTNPPAE